MTPARSSQSRRPGHRCKSHLPRGLMYARESVDHSLPHVFEPSFNKAFCNLQSIPSAYLALASTCSPRSPVTFTIAGRQHRKSLGPGQIPPMKCFVVQLESKRQVPPAAQGDLVQHCTSSGVLGHAPAMDVPPTELQDDMVSHTPGRPPDPVQPLPIWARATGHSRASWAKRERCMLEAGLVMLGVVLQKWPGGVTRDGDFYIAIAQIDAFEDPVHQDRPRADLDSHVELMHGLRRVRGNSSLLGER